ncbi:hypothetical protein [Novosphingobium mangrovi (ex Hu et al. 2023)]|uniref:Uncharacterized protein n=1 Tax=Novosphingobium mangrovi (ex Hu et al. 2023) TaxID=2930094 RepID=A0ABT0A8W9_9SPHN|nr:hypothetical protein [Novosphingobium mangrovi (ex Hu et al. 2023)]MCJ1959649.1 hypothetical protein [Novosphingobium mangrovi (ex Hu et al. 2023)]
MAGAVAKAGAISSALMSPSSRNWAEADGPHLQSENRLLNGNKGSSAALPLHPMNQSFKLLRLLGRDQSFVGREATSSEASEA